jgi:flagellar hook-basal body complex protein FliE
VNAISNLTAGAAQLGTQRVEERIGSARAERMQPESAAAAGGTPGAAFGELLSDAIETANADQFTAEAAARDLAAGKGDVVDAMVATAHADVSLRFLMTLRNRVLDAYQEIMRLQV